MRTLESIACAIIVALICAVLSVMALDLLAGYDRMQKGPVPEMYRALEGK